MEFNYCTVITALIVLLFAVLFVPKGVPCVFHDMYGYVTDLVKKAMEKKAPAPVSGERNGEVSPLVK